MMLDGEEYYTCVCSSFDHTLRFVLDLDRTTKIEDHPLPTIYTEVQMNYYLPWYKRLWLGIKYIFGYDVRHPYNCWEINGEGEDPDKMIAMLHKLKDELHSNKIKMEKLKSDE